MWSLRILCAAFVLGVSATAAADLSPDAVLPPVVEVQRRALRHAKFDIAEIASWQRRARQAALVPRIQFDIGKRLRNNINIGIQDNVYVGSGGIVVGPEEGDYTNARTNDLTIGVRAVWELGEAVFSPKQLAVSAEARRAVKDRNLLMADVNRHYYNVAGFEGEARLMRASEAAAKRPKFVELKVYQRKISCRESLAQLDALTDGWFSRELGADGFVCGEGKGGEG
jgi:hypothetical protein